MALLGLGASKANASWDCALTIDPQKSLLISDLDVVDNPRTERDGPWSFAQIFKRATAFADEPGHLAYDWLDQYKSIATFNGFPLPERTAGPLLAIWPRQRGTDGIPQADNLNLSHQPLRLLAIVFRPDLATSQTFGEGRFVFGVDDPVAGPQDMTLIFEFKMAPTDQFKTKASWYEAIAELSIAATRNDYFRLLQRLTDALTYPQAGRTRLLQLRTNDQYFGQGWDLREFFFNSRQQRLQMRAVAKTPDFSLRTASALVTWVKANSAEIFAESFALPLEFQSASGFLPDDRFDWLINEADLDPMLRQQFAKTTCSGCHGRATHTAFLHLTPRRRNEETQVSDFLSAELFKRNASLEAVLCGGI